jgi:CRP/FNR family transcriptional regulator
MIVVERAEFSSGRCSRCPQREQAFCALADRAARSELSRISHTRSYDPDQVIIADNAPAGLVGVVIAGVVKLTKTMQDGRQQVVGLRYPGQFVGRPFAVTTDFSYEAATEVDLCVMEQAVFDAVLRRHPDLEHALLLDACAELALAQERMLLLGSQPTLERLAGYLVLMLERNQLRFTRLGLPPQKLIARSQISRRDLASYLSTTIETISRHIHTLSRTGVIRIIDSSHFEVLDPDRLLDLSGLSRDDLQFFRRNGGERQPARTSLASERPTPDRARLQA